MRKFRLYKTSLIAIMIALSTVIYMIFPEIPLVPGVEYLKVDLSDIPALVTGMTVGPLAGFLVELFKNLIHLTRTTTFGIGELINVGIGSVMIFTTYAVSRTIAERRTGSVNAVAYYIAAIAAIIATILAGWVLNAALTPLYFIIMHWPLTTVTWLAGVWGSTLLNAVKCAVTVLPFWPLIRILRKVNEKFV